MPFKRYLFVFFVFLPCLSALSQTYQKVKYTPEPSAQTPKDIQPAALSAEGKVLTKDSLGNYIPLVKPKIPYQPPLISDALVGGPDIYLQDGSETSIAINYDNMNNLVAGYNEHWDFNPDIPHSNSTNGNVSWTSRSFPNGAGSYTGPPFDPWVNVGNASSEFFSTQIRRDAVATGNTHSIVSRSIDGGASFSLFYEKVKAVFQDREMVDIDRTTARGGGAGSTHDGKAYLCYDDWGAGGGGYVGSFLQVLSSAGAPLTELQIADLVGAFEGNQMQPVSGTTDGTVYVMASAIGGVPSGATIFANFHQITNAGAGPNTYIKSSLSWPAAGQQLGATSRWGLNGHRIDNHGYLDIDLSSGPRRGYLYFISNRNPNPSNSALDQGDISLSYSTNGASSWVTTTIPAAAGKTQYFPMMDVDENGWIHVAYYQNETGLTNGGVLNAGSANIYYTLSTDGGFTWLTPVQVNAPANTLDMQDPPPNLSPNYYMVGDYAQVQARGTLSSTKVYALWTGFDKDRSGGLGDTDDRVLCTIVCAAKSGDANGDGTVGLADIIFLANYVFKGGTASFPICAGDANGSGGSPGLPDIIYLANHVFKGGALPVKIGLCCM